jgi:HK97 gp10 family phage protein
VSVKVKVTGLDAALKQLQGYSDEVKEKCKAAVRDHTEAIKAQAVAAAPVDTGRLKSEIETDYSSLGYFGRVRAKTPYAHCVELGTVKQQAQPFLQPSFESEKAKFVADIKAIVKS